MNAPVKADPVEVAMIENALDVLLSAIIAEDETEPLVPHVGLEAARDSVNRAIDQLEWSQARRQAARLLQYPVAQALRNAVRTLGRRLHEIDPREGLDHALHRLCDRNPAEDHRRDDLLAACWDGMGGRTR